MTERPPADGDLGAVRWRFDVHQNQRLAEMTKLTDDFAYRGESVSNRVCFRHRHRLIFRQCNWARNRLENSATRATFGGVFTVQVRGFSWVIAPWLRASGCRLNHWQSRPLSVAQWLRQAVAGFPESCGLRAYRRATRNLSIFSGGNLLQAHGLFPQSKPERGPSSGVGTTLDLWISKCSATVLIGVNGFIGQTDNPCRRWQVPAFAMSSGSEPCSSSSRAQASARLVALNPDLRLLEMHFVKAPSAGV